MTSHDIDDRSAHRRHEQIDTASVVVANTSHAGLLFHEEVRLSKHTLRGLDDGAESPYETGSSAH